MNLRKLATLTGLYLPLQALACEFPAGFLQRVSLDPGNLVVGRDAPVGTVIYPVGGGFQTVKLSIERIECPQETTFEVTTPLRQEEGSPWVNPGEVLLHIGIPNVALVVATSLGTHSGYWQYIPGQGRNGMGVPHREIVRPVQEGSTIRVPFLSSFVYDYRLVKVGPIDPGMGPQSLNGLTLATFTSSRSGRVLELVFTGGTLNVAQCGLPGSPSQQVRVPMGTWQVAQFAGAGSFTESREFVISLRNCVGGEVPGNSPTAYLRLDPRNGSPVLDAPQGIIGLNSESDATGVGVQVLQYDRTPVRLSEEVPIFQFADGDFEIPFAARYIQLADRAPTAGVANASLSFTLTYK
ncbi:fimbrial protein [Pseudomonas sp. NPDC089406]|uniref:fimbrial protein n=1 Tax=Pseudomonas sp. NPDC089406 TaxID=3364463 RepID=UPI00385000B6